MGLNNGAFVRGFTGGGRISGEDRHDHCRVFLFFLIFPENMPLKALNTEIPGCQQYTLQDWDQSYQCASAVIYWKRKARRSKTFKASATWDEPKVFTEPKVPL